MNAVTTNLTSPDRMNAVTTSLRRSIDMQATWSTIATKVLSRRDLLRRCSLGFGGLALAALLGDEARGQAESAANPLAPRPPHFPARAKRIIFLFMKGGPSQVDTFDPKPRLQRDDGKPLPFPKPRLQFAETGNLLASPWKFQKYGQSGIEVSELFPHVARCVDDLCVVRSLYGSNPAHGGATLKLHTGSDNFIRPSLGSWVAYGLGTENHSLPAFVTLSPTLFHGGVQNYGTAFLPAVYQGTAIGHAGIPAEQARIAHLTNPENPPRLQRLQLDLVRQLNRRHLRDAGPDATLEARIESFELAFRMQTAVPELQDLSGETRATRQLYGLDDPVTHDFGYQCLLARRFAERGVRFIEVTHQKGVGHWDQHETLLTRHPENARQVDRPIAGLLTDLKARGLLKDTLVLWGGEFGRTPVAQGTDRQKVGRDHNPEGFTMWLAGGGVKGGHVHGATDEFGYYAVADKVHFHDLHATLLHLLGLDHKRLTYRHAGRDFRLTDVAGEVVQGVLA
jgi:hypothetical protein